MLKEKFIPLLHAEKRIYVLQKLHPESSMWNVPSSLRLAMADPGKLEEAIRFVVQTYPSLRTRFTEQNGNPVKYLVDDYEARIERLDFTGRGEEAYLAWAAEQSSTPLPMLDDTPYRLAVAEAGNGTVFLYSNYHHIVVDGGGSDLVQRRVIDVYEALLEGRQPQAHDTPPLTSAFDEEQRYLSSEACAADRDYWHTVFETIPEPMDVAGRPSAQSIQLQMHTHRFSPGTTRALLEYCSRERVSPFRVVLAGMGIVFSRTLRRQDTVLGTATANRHPAELREAVGMFVSTCALRMQIEPELAFQEVVGLASNTLRQAVAHERYPYDRLSSELRQRTGEAPDLIACTLVEMVRAPLPDYVEVITHCHGESLIPMACFLQYPHRDAPPNMPVEMLMMFNEEMFEPWRIKELCSHTETVIRNGMRAPGTRVSEIALMEPVERRRLVERFNETEADWEVETTVHACIEEAAKRFPGHAAVVYRGRSLTYEQLEARANVLARKLRERGAGPGSIVGLLADRSIDIIVGQIGILKSGAAFMPIDAGYPDERIQFMLEDVGAPVILTQSRFIEDRDFGRAVILNMDDAETFQGNAAPVENLNAPHDLCAVIYTSGSTGKPKGVLLEHRSLCNIIHAAIRDHDITPEDRLSKHASFSFDASMLEVFSALMSGAQLHVIPEEIRLSLTHLNDYFETNHITWAFLTTQLGEQFMEFIDNRSLQTLAVGGEKLRTFKPRRYRFLNIYGPTECSIYATQHTVEQFEENIPIGRPVANYRIYILDKHGHPQPAGYAGELCIAGPGVGRGYHQRPQKTAECFVPDPFRPGEQMYRTGDLASWTPEGGILHLGRIDRQVKLRGFRIELGEIENAMLSLEGITQAAVADFKDSTGHLFLCGYFCGETIDPETVRQQLSSRLPKFMVPAYIQQLDAMPVNPSGKIDRKQLPRLEVSPKDAERYVEPEGELEKALAGIWGEVLDQQKVSAEADFFQSGGDSLRAVALQLSVVQTLDRDVELSVIFEYPTPRKMAAFLEHAEPGRQQAIPRAAPAESYPTTIAQQQLFLLSRMQGIGTAYNMPLCISLEGKLNRYKLSDALLQLLQRHESLRTAFEIRDGRCRQRVMENVYLKLEFAQTADKDPANFAAGFVRPFDLAAPPLMRAKLVAYDSSRHWLLLDFHHIAFDGVSVGVFLRELLSLYRSETLEPLPIQHKDFAAWEAGRSEESRIRHEGFWLDLFADPPEAELPTDMPRPAHPSFEGASYHHLFDAGLAKRLRVLAKSQAATLHQVFLAGLAVLTGRWSDSEDVCLGTSMSGRDRLGTASVVGMFVRTLPTRHRPTEAMSFAGLLARTKKQMLAIHEHGEYPISSLYEQLGVNRGPGRHPLFDINFVMRNTGMETLLQSDGIQAQVSFLGTGTAKFDLSFAAEEQGDALVLEVDYRTSLYRRDTVARMAGHLTRILEAVADAPEQPLGDIDMLGPEERATLITRFNPPATPAPEWPTVCHAIARQAVEHPDQPAVVAEDGTLTYAELDRLANRAARAIHAAGGGPDRIVAVVAARSVWSVVGMLAALKSGSAYVGLDVHYPTDRIAFILDDTRTPCVVGTVAQVDGVDFAGPKIALDGALPEDSGDPGLARGGSDLAYCIFTSGSTGTPKGVLIEHHSMVNFIDWYATHHRMQPGSNCAAFAAFSFDVSVVQIFAPLVSGATLHVIAEDLRRSPLDLDAYFSRNRVSHAHFPTQFAEQFMRMCKAETLQYMVVGGDRLKSYQMNGYRLTNEYGPSETAMACLSYDVPEVMAQPPVGSPVANTRIYILDSKGRLCPLGLPGEICVAGAGVGRGYLNREELTAKSFVADPFVPGKRMFRTGDKCRWLGNGVVDFIGRMDFQVKIRGYRVEPGEIEALIKETGQVFDCVVVAIEESTGSKALAAYCTASTEFDGDALKTTLTQRLPEYMVPAYVVQLEKMPLNPNGKIDRGKLPRPEITSTTAGPLEPRNPKEKYIAEIWEKVLGHRGFGLYDSFYNVGGDSLSAIALLAALSELFDISASDIFAHTTIADQAAHFQEAEVGRSARLLRLKDLVQPVPADEAFDLQLKQYAEDCTGDAGLDTDTVKPFWHVLLTGATGTLGIYLLRELLDSTEAAITAIVRAKDHGAAFERLAEHFQDRFGKDLERQAGDRLTVLTGELAQPGFGMQPNTYARLAEEVDTILHSAALTSHYGDWETFVAANITSVENLLQFAGNGRNKTMHHVSTTSIGAGRIEGRRQTLFTEFDTDIGQKPGNLYVSSKLEAELTLQKAREEGLSLNIYRAGNVTCDSVTGAFQRNVEDNAFYQQLRAYVNLGAAPDALDVRNMTFVDQAARAIVVLMGRPGLAGQTFHIQNPQLLSLSSALSGDGLGLRLSRLPFDGFVEFIAQHAGCSGFDQYVDRLLVHLGWQDWLVDSTATATAIRVERTVELLERCGFSWKKPEPADLRRFVAQALQDRVLRIRAIPGFENLDDATLSDLAACVRPEYFAGDHLLQQESRPVDGIRFVMEGMVETYRQSAVGWIGTVRVGGPGSCLGEEAVPGDRDAINSVEALDGVFAFQVEPRSMRELIMKHPQLGLSLLKVVSVKADQAERLFVAM